MSIKTFQEAMDSVLYRESTLREELIVLRPGAKRALDDSDRDIALPRLGASAFSIALGAALAGMHPVLDLRSDPLYAEELLDELFSLLSSAHPVTVIIPDPEAKVFFNLAGVHIFAPETPRQAAGFMRAALRCSGVSVFIPDESLLNEDDEIPDDDDFMLLPPAPEEAENAGTDVSAEPEFPDNAPMPPLTGSAENADECSGNDGDQLTDEQIEMFDHAEKQITESFSFEEYLRARRENELRDGRPVHTPGLPEESSTVIITSDPDIVRSQSAPDDSPAVIERPAPSSFAMRMLTIDLSNLFSIADGLEAPRALLVSRCMERLSQEQPFFEWEHDENALPGEAAFLPPEQAPAFLWLGHDVLTVCFDLGRLSSCEAARLLRAAARLLKNPLLLIYDKERDKA